MVLARRPRGSLHGSLVIIEFLYIQHFSLHLGPCLKVLALHDFEEDRVELQGLLRGLEDPNLVLQPLGPSLLLELGPVPLVQEDDQPIVIHMSDDPAYGLVD